MNRLAKRLLIVTTILSWMGLVWQTGDDLPNSPNIPPAKHSWPVVLHASPRK